MIKIRNLTKRFDDHVIFDSFDAEIPSQMITVIKGESGCGKSTLLNIIGKLDQEYTGEVYVDNKNLKKDKINQTEYLRDTIGYLFQNFALIDSLTVSQNLDIVFKYKQSLDKESEKINALLKVGLNEGYLKKKIYTLSGGEQQRVALARLLIKPCTIILADEPTGSVDEKNADIILKMLDVLKENGRTIVIATHDKNVMNHADHIIDLQSS